MAAHPTDDAIWDHTDPCDMSIDIVNNAVIITSSHIMEESTSTCCKFDSHELLPVTVSMSHEDDESCFDAHKFFDSWYDTSETMDNYDKWDKPANTYCVVNINNESTNKYIETNFYIGKYQTELQDV